MEASEELLSTNVDGSAELNDHIQNDGSVASAFRVQQVRKQK